MGGERPEVAADVLTELRTICLELPDAWEEPAWTGTRWKVRQRTFAHVLAIGNGWPPSMARNLGDEIVTILTFSATGEELDALRHAGHPFFPTHWARDALGMVIDDATDWEEVGELLTESYCLLAPKKLSALVERPAAE
jgi:hypothetical protein